MKRPLLWPALLFASGVALAEFIGLPFTVLFAIAGGGLLTAAGFAKIRLAALLGVSLLAGWVNHSLRFTALAPHDLRHLVGTNTVLAKLRGAIRDTPALKLVERRGVLSGRTLFRVRVEAIQLDGVWRPAFGEVAVSLKGAIPTEFFRTQRLEIGGMLRPPPGPVAEGLFDYATHLRHQNVWFVLLADGAHDWRLPADAIVKPPLSERFLPWAQAALAHGLPDDEATRLIWAMALGWKTALTGEVDTAFMESGTMHVFAISGLHIALIAGAIVALLRTLRVSRGWCGVVVAPLMWFYVAATGWQTSAIRSVLMSTIVIGGWSLERPGDLFNSLAAALLAVLLWDPGQLFQASFQLSFGVVGGMALLVPVIEPRVLTLVRIDPDPFLPDELRPRWQRWAAEPLRQFALLLAASVAALIASLPLTVHYFHLLNPVSLLANLLVVPMSGITLAANVASLAVGGWWPALGEVFNASAWLWMRGMVIVSRAAADLPGGVHYVASPRWGWWVAYYLALLAVATGWALRPAVRRCFAGLAAGTGLAAVLTGWLGSRFTEVTFLAGGKATVVDSRGRRNDVLLDTGSESTATALVIPFLQAHGWNRLPTLGITHGDLQHVGGGDLMLDAFPVDRLVLGPAKARSAAFRQFVRATEARKIPNRIAASGDDLAGWQILHPAREDQFTTADDNALVLSRVAGGVRLLLLSDLGRHGQRALLERGGNLRADVVVAGIPREAEPLGDALLAALGPQLIILTAAEFPAPERVKPATRQRLLDSGRQILFTTDCGTVSLRIKDASIQVRAMDGTRLEIFPRAVVAPPKVP